MDVNPPSTLRRLGIALAGLSVAALTGAACALSFDDLRALAITGEARQDLAFLYPAAFDALLVVALLGVLLLRQARLLVRLQAAFVLILLIAAAAAVDVASAVRFAFDVRQAAIGVAVAPWVMVAVALWLWLLLIKHVQAGRVARGADDEATAERDIVPFDGGQTPPPLDTRSPAPALEATPVVGPTPAPETPPVSTRVTEWPAQAERDPDQAPEPARVPEPRRAPEPVLDAELHRTPEPATSRAPVTEPETDPGPETDPEPAGEQETTRDFPTAREPVQEPEPEAEPTPVQAPQPQPDVVDPAPERAPEPDPYLTPDRTPEPDPNLTPDRTPEPGPEPAPEQAPEPSPEPETRPVRWGDRVRPADVLVHPRPPAEDPDRDADTQPHPIIEDNTPDPLHGPESADAAEPRPRPRLNDTAPHPVVDDDTPAPAGRLRSTPRPPEDRPEDRPED